MSPHRSVQQRTDSSHSRSRSHFKSALRRVHSWLIDCSLPVLAPLVSHVCVQRSMSPLSVREAAGARESKRQSSLLEARTSLLDDVAHSASLRRSQLESEQIWRASANMQQRSGTEMQKTAAAGAAQPQQEEEEKKEAGAGAERPSETVATPIRARGGSGRSQGELDRHGQSRIWDAQTSTADTDASCRFAPALTVSDEEHEEALERALDYNPIDSQCVLGTTNREWRQSKADFEHPVALIQPFCCCFAFVFVCM